MLVVENRPRDREPLVSLSAARTTTCSRPRRARRRSACHSAPNGVLSPNVVQCGARHKYPLPTSSSVTAPFDCHLGSEAAQEDSIESSTPEKRVGPHMFATIRRYDAIDQDHVADLAKKVDETLVPILSELPGFSAYYLLDAGNGIMTRSASSTRLSTPTSPPTSPQLGSASRSWRTYYRMPRRSARRGRRSEDSGARSGVARRPFGEGTGGRASGPPCVPVRDAASRSPRSPRSSCSRVPRAPSRLISARAPRRASRGRRPSRHVRSCLR